ncbi:MAG: ribosomal subunit interface protein [Candidatus Harrisonbacteria bacterium RIFCSPLOWO2_01_FULL_40_28]|uniref:Ribosomal subunit interface protein n=1 Tax=Candidatus Harrisonbacteria bacterium RIFCSPLOWO2_01_FULL_40_28 TaxID=1798406 RepID=A0A1G1ZKM2_9BACT|nr:MAG: ribosomal subunit interface protein [Candidatus Harrisonbacteria bacterium RIFCSPLOWO2_01_FULL_40_28]
MNISIKGTNLDLTSSIKEFIEEKIGSLHKFIGKTELEEDVKVFVEIARTTRHHAKGEVFYAEATMHMHTHTFRAEDTSEDIRVSINNVRHKLEEQIKKHRDAHLSS